MTLRLGVEFGTERYPKCFFYFSLININRHIQLYHGKNICRLFHTLAQFPFITSDRGTRLLSP